jgi:hypothetical protein
LGHPQNYKNLVERELKTMKNGLHRNGENTGGISWAEEDGFQGKIWFASSKGLAQGLTK